MYDAIVIGSRMAGAPTAMLLSRRGRRVLLVDRAAFPSDVLSGHTIQPTGMARLARWGLLDRVVATGVPLASTVRFDFGPVVLEGSPAPIEGQRAAACIRRTVIDPLLADAAVEAGAELRLGTAVTELVMDGGRVTGVRGHGPHGEPFEARASVVVGADGARSFVARAVDAPMLVHRPASTSTVYSYWQDLPVGGLELYARPGRFFVTAPTNDGLTLVAVQFPVGAARAFRGRAGEGFAESLVDVPDLARRIGSARRVERFRFAQIADSFIRRSHGAGWALAGDASCHKDPITAQGMGDALRDADLLADAIDAGLGTGSAAGLDRALARYQARRDAEARPMFDHTAALADLEAPPAPEVLELIAALQGRPEHIARFLGVTAGSVGVAEFFAPDSVGRILGHATAA
jgi:2-polyprenyl-6-methoxyphenol hydroxylase-like FAD-dependent oxidoreductase